MHIVIAPQALKGSLSAAETGEAIAAGVQAVFPGARTTILPIADGGEGTVQALVDATGGQIVQHRVTGPLGEPVSAFFGLLGDDQTAVIEMAACAGLPLVPPDKRDPRFTTTYGVGELICAALDAGCRHFLIAIGGSATNDGGVGMAQALGIQFTDASGNELPPGGGALASLAHISIRQIDPRLADCRFEVACDVTNPLYGPHGASAIYGPQKGATPEMVEELDDALRHFASIIEQDLDLSIADVPGAGAAGGLGAGLLAFLHASLRPGAQLVLESAHLSDYLSSADLLITAEGQIDMQTAYGKSVGAVAQLAQSYQVPVLALAGSLGFDYQGVYALGIDAVAVLPSGPMSLAHAMAHAAALTQDATARALGLLKLGQRLRDR